MDTNGYTPNSGSYGKLLPDIGVLLLNGNALDAPAVSGGLAFATNRTANTAGANQGTFYDLL